jgi:hypothetical protein
MAVRSSSQPSAAAVETTPRFHAALTILQEAHDYACKLGRSVWDFAVEICHLRAAGLSSSDLRWLICQGLVEHGAEVTREGEDHRTFCRTGTLSFTRTTCFVLTDSASDLPCPTPAALAAVPDPEPPAPPPPQLASGTPLMPQWDKKRQELRLGGLVVKQFKVPAPNQEMILASFEEEGWPPRIDDPLPPHLDHRDTVRRSAWAPRGSPWPRRWRASASAARSRSGDSAADLPLTPKWGSEIQISGFQWPRSSLDTFPSFQRALGG